MTKDGLGIATTIGCRRCGRRVCIIDGQDNVCGPCRDVEQLQKENKELRAQLEVLNDMLVSLGAGELEDLRETCRNVELLQKENRELRAQIKVLCEMLDVKLGWSRFCGGEENDG